MTLCGMPCMCSLRNRPGNMDGPTLPIIGNPMLCLFHLLEFLPTVCFLAVTCLVTVFYMLLLLESYAKLFYENPELEKPIHINCWQSFCKWADGQLGTVATVAFPNLFSMRHISIASELESADNEQHVQADGRRLVKEILFLNRATKFGTYDSRKTCTYSGRLIRVFGMLGTIILLLSAGAFFRYFPVTLGTECVEDGKFNTWFCYYANASISDQAINCTLYNINNPPDESNSSALICYAISGELAKSSAAAVGLYQISSICVFLAVRFALNWNRWCGKVRGKMNKKPGCKTCQCIMHKYCCVFVYSVACFILFITIAFFLLYTYIPNSISNEYTSNHYLTGEFVYRFSFVYIFIFLGIFFLVLPITLIHYKGMNSSYYFLASEGKEELQTTESDSGSNNGYDEIRQSGENYPLNEVYVHDRV